MAVKSKKYARVHADKRTTDREAVSHARSRLSRVRDAEHRSEMRQYR
jgi:hypothetical protein